MKQFLDPNFMVRKREEQKAFIQRMQAETDYEKRYKIFHMAFENILKMLEVEQKSLSQFDHKEGQLPATPKEFKGVATIAENICIVAEVVLHFPEISYKILEGFPNWRKLVEYGQEIAQKYQHVYDDSTLELLSLFNQEINPEQRTDDFINPYAAKEEEKVKPSKTKAKKQKLKKGPALQEF